MWSPTSNGYRLQGAGLQRKPFYLSRPGGGWVPQRFPTSAFGLDSTDSRSLAFPFSHGCTGLRSQPHPGTGEIGEQSSQALWKVLVSASRKENPQKNAPPPSRLLRYVYSTLCKHILDGEKYECFRWRGGVRSVI